MTETNFELFQHGSSLHLREALVIRVTFNFIVASSAYSSLHLDEIFDVFGLRSPHPHPFNIHPYASVMLGNTANIRDGLEKGIHRVKVESPVRHGLSSDISILGSDLGYEDTSLVGQQDTPQVFFASIEIAHYVCLRLAQNSRNEH